ncbi:dimethylamine monooxygenase subunit DmmA family protein [Paracoccus binzhouensis]|uniref:dimethylamine monooxygenase subunit DmmA family protein n=1 Tax=Paracoccus binzhouensis TaxID=2796149 RepID=UPI0018EEE81A|nr:dimethylamine monooxygenase subunit DmmA family protein [Paracoccus binzhouensis]
MRATEFSPSIPSRPVYGGLRPHGALPSLMLAEGAGGEALAELAKADPPVMRHAQLFYVPSGAPAGPDLAARLRGLGPASYVEGPSWAALRPRFVRALADAHMGTRLYLAGSEGLIGQAMAEALAAGLPLEAIDAEHRGDIARRMQCVHCKGITENVTTDPFICAHCGLNLFVRDHYSRRIGAFQGVCVDAETPGIVPEPQEIKP